MHGTYRDDPEDTSWLPNGVTLHQIDLLHGAAVCELVERTRPQIVHHLAAQSSVALSWQDPMDTLTQNAGAQFNVLEAVRDYVPQARVVVVGSCDEYGNVAPEDNPIPEDHCLRPVSPYGLSKVTQDLMGLQYADAYGLAVMRVRPFLQLGPRRSERFVAGSFARQVSEIEIGQHEPRIQVGTIDLQRDFTDVRDVAEALIRVANKGITGEVYNIASETAHSLRDLLHIMLTTAGMYVEISPDETRVRRGEPPVLIGSARRLRATTGWQPAIPFEQSARDTLSYWRDRIRLHA